MRVSAIISWLLLVGLVSSCGSSPAPAPEPGPFTGAFSVGQEDVGSFAFTVSPGAILGSGTIWLEGEPYQVTLVGLVNDGQIDGNLDSVEQRTEFNGKFVNSNRATGTFSFIVAAGQLEGVWVASIPIVDTPGA